MNTKIFRLILTVAVAISVIALCSPIFADGIVRDEFGREIVVIPPTVLTVNGDTIQPDEGLNSSNYTINSDDNCLIEIVGNDTLKGSVTLEGSGIFLINSAFNIEGQITVLGGEFYTGDNVINAGSFYAGLYKDDTPIYLDLGASPINVFAWAIRGNGVKIDAGTSTINTTLLFDDAVRTGHIYNNINIKEKVTTTTNVTWNPRSVSSIVNGQIVTRTVYDKVETTSTSTVYGFVEGNSKFNALKIEDAGKVYVASAAIQAVTTTVTKGTLAPVIAGKVTTISKGSLETAKTDSLKTVAPIGKVIIGIGK